MLVLDTCLSVTSVHDRDTRSRRALLVVLTFGVFYFRNGDSIRGCE